MGEDLYFYHGGLPEDFDFSELDAFRLAQKQQKGGNYAGFYMTEHPDTGNYYAQQNGGALHQLKLGGNAVVRDFEGGNIERLEQEYLRKMASEGVDVLRGKNSFKNTEYVLLNPSAIKETNVIDPQFFGNKTTSGLGHMFSKPLDNGILQALKNGAGRLARTSGKALPVVGNVLGMYDMYKQLEEFQNNQSMYDPYTI